MGMNHAYGKPAPKEDMVKLLRHAVDLECAFFDTAVVLEHGDQALVTARNSETVQLFRERFPQMALPLQLDVTKEKKVSVRMLL